MAEKVAKPAPKSSSKPSSEEAKGEVAAPKPANTNSNLIMIFVFGLALLILLDPGLRQGLGSAVGNVFDPLFGFNYQYPILTLLITGLIMTCSSILLRHFFTDYVAQAENQKITGAYNKELRQARLDNNTYKLKKLLEQQPQIMKRSLEQTKTQFKLMPVTMIIIIPIFAWLAVFVGNLPSTIFAVPWSFEANLTDAYLFPAWILVYTLVTIPFGQVLSRLLRYYSFNKRLAKLAAQGK